MRFPHGQSALEMDELRMGIEVRVALLAIKQMCQAQRSQAQSSSTGPVPTSILHACGGQCPTPRALKPRHLFHVLPLILRMTLDKPCPHSLPGPHSGIPSKLLAVPIYGVNDTGLGRVQAPAVLMWGYFWFAYSFIDSPWTGSSLEAGICLTHPCISSA